MAASSFIDILDAHKVIKAGKRIHKKLLGIADEFLGWCRKTACCCFKQRENLNQINDARKKRLSPRWRVGAAAVRPSLPQIVEAMNQDSGARLTQLQVDGGMTANQLLMQLQADILHIPVGEDTSPPPTPRALRCCYPPPTVGIFKLPSFLSGVDLRPVKRRQHLCLISARRLRGLRPHAFSRPADFCPS